jgi:hypothetical protein
MALVARKVLAECETAHQFLKTERVASATWRPHWVLCLTLLRAVGHVLDKVDGEADAKHNTAISAKCEEWKANIEENRTFWDFTTSPKLRAAVSTSPLACKRAEKTRILMPVWDASTDTGDMPWPANA